MPIFGGQFRLDEVGQGVAIALHACVWHVSARKSLE
jgi:hypothetical protein